MTGVGTPQARPRESGIAIGLDRAHSARVCDALCGRSTNFTVDRDLARRIQQILPLAPIAVVAGRQFLHRAAGYLAARGLNQFLDLGAGLPQTRNLHDMIRPLCSEARVLYIDHDPIVIAHLKAIFGAGPADGVAILHADVTTPESLLAAVTAQGVVDLARPVAVVMGAILDHLPPDAEPGRLLEALAAQLAPGSALAFTHAAADLNDAVVRAARVCRDAGIDLQPRTCTEVEALFTGWDLVEPGVRPASRWRTEGLSEPDESAPVYAGVAILPPRPRCPEENRGLIRRGAQPHEKRDLPS